MIDKLMRTLVQVGVVIVVYGVFARARPTTVPA